MNKMNKEINLKEKFNLIKKRLWILIVLTLLFTVLGIIYTMQPQTSLYSASTRVILRADIEIMGTLKVMVREPVVLDKVIESLQLRRSSNALRGQISVNNVEGSTVLVINVVDTDPEIAVKIANATATIYKQQTALILNFTNISILSEAILAPNPQPINQRGNSAIAICLIIGLVLGIGLIFILDSLDDSLKCELDAELWLELPVLGYVAKMNKRDIRTAAMRKKNQITSQSLRGETIGS